MSDNIEYNDQIIMEIFRREVCQKAGAEAWDALVKDGGVPDIAKEPSCGCAAMRSLMNRFDENIKDETGKAILVNVRHGLTHAQFAVQREQFLACGDLDAFLQQDYENELRNFTRLCDNGEDFYGQPITREALDFILSQPGMLAAVRKGNELHVTAFPSEIAAYLHETDERQKRYRACHCPFAKESILSEEGMVSKTLCHCSLGHCMVRWEAIFERKLEGDVMQSVLGGALQCKYVIYLPDDIIQRYVRS